VFGFFFLFLKKGVSETTPTPIDSLTEHNAEYQEQHMRKYAVSNEHQQQKALQKL